MCSHYFKKQTQKNCPFKETKFYCVITDSTTKRNTHTKIFAHFHHFQVSFRLHFSSPLTITARKCRPQRITLLSGTEQCLFRVSMTVIKRSHNHSQVLDTGAEISQTQKRIMQTATLLKHISCRCWQTTATLLKHTSCRC